MTGLPVYPKRLIEVDLPIGRISKHARKEKSIRHGHISTLHIWWARRPLAACRAVICASLWLDPGDPLCPLAFRDAAHAAMSRWATDYLQLSGPESAGRFVALQKNPARLDEPVVLRQALLDFIADFADWDHSTDPAYLATARALTQAAHEALGCEPGTRPMVVDPFAGGGAIPLEALRVGADAFASDLNPVAVLLNKVVLEYIPRYGQRLADEVRKWGAWVKEQAELELAEFYPQDPDGATPIAYLWARTITCEGPGCGAEVPLIRSRWLSKRKGKPGVALKMAPNTVARRVDFTIEEKAKTSDLYAGTSRRGSATCPICGYTTPVASVRNQLRSRRGGAADARLFAIAVTRAQEQGRSFRLPTPHDLEIVQRAQAELERKNAVYQGLLSMVPNERLDIRGIRHTWVMIYGLERWGDYYTPRQLLALTTLTEILERAECRIMDYLERDFAVAVLTVLALGVSRLADISNSLCSWKPSMAQAIHVFARQAIPMVWDFAETGLLSDAAGDYATTIANMTRILEREAGVYEAGQAYRASATAEPLADDMADAYITDPPYYDAVPYSYLSEFFYVWLRRGLGRVHPELFQESHVEKDIEIIVDRPHELSNSTKDIAFYERELTRAFTDGRRVLRPGGIGTIVFASKTTASWEAILQAVVDAQWTITGSWPIDTEMQTRVAAQEQARLGSSIHLVCRPRESPDGQVVENVGDWGDVLAELPPRMHEWMLRLSNEGVVGADAIFACLGPALEIFSRYSRVEKVSGDAVPLREYLEQVWAAVAREAMSVIFAGADTSGFEEDARLTAIWFWVLKAAANGNGNGNHSLAATEADEDEEEAEESQASGKKLAGYLLEYDAARKLAQGLGVDLVRLSRPGGIVKIQGSTVALNGIATREPHLIGVQVSLDGQEVPLYSRGARGQRHQPNMSLSTVQARQPSLFPDEAEVVQAGLPMFPAVPTQLPIMEQLEANGQTVLDRLHQAMLLFGRGQTALLMPFLEKTYMAANPHFWDLAQALSALYPTSSDEKRWVDGVLGRKKGMGL